MRTAHWFSLGDAEAESGTAPQSRANVRVVSASRAQIRELLPRRQAELGALHGGQLAQDAVLLGVGHQGLRAGPYGPSSGSGLAGICPGISEESGSC